MVPSMPPQSGRSVAVGVFAHAAQARRAFTASFAIASIVSGTVPVEAPTPRLSNVITRCVAAMPSTTRGSQLSSTAGQVGEEDHRDASLGAELAVGEIHSTGGDRAGRCVLVRRDHVF